VVSTVRFPVKVVAPVTANVLLIAAAPVTSKATAGFVLLTPTRSLVESTNRVSVSTARFPETSPFPLISKNVACTSPTTSKRPLMVPVAAVIDPVVETFPVVSATVKAPSTSNPPV